MRPGFGEARVSSVARDLGMSERQLHRRCVAAVGYGPVLLRRVLRFRRFVSRIDADGALDDLAVLAAEAGYADQAHLTRESGEARPACLRPPSPGSGAARLCLPGTAGRPTSAGRPGAPRMAGHPSLRDQTIGVARTHRSSDTSWVRAPAVPAPGRDDLKSAAGYFWGTEATE